MKSIEQLKSEVRMKIQEAFQATQHPDYKNFITGKTGSDIENTKILNAFGKRPWEDISVEVLKTYGEALSLFAPPAFRYYLPSYMLGCAEFYYEVDIARDSVIFNLTPPKDRTGWEWEFFENRVKQFTKKEGEAIASFLELIEQYEQNDWMSEGINPPENRVKHALDFWTEITTKY